MTNIHNELMQHLKDEAHDVCEYAMLSEKAEEEGHDTLSEKLEMIAYDEFTHAYTIKHCRERMGLELDNEAKMLWEKAEKAFHDM